MHLCILPMWFIWQLPCHLENNATLGHKVIAAVLGSIGKMSNATAVVIGQVDNMNLLSVILHAKGNGQSVILQACSTTRG